MITAIAALSLLLLTQAGDLPEVTVTTPHTKISQSCRIKIPEGTILADDGTGAIIIDADNITVEFEKGSVLRGADVGQGKGQTPWDQLSGTGINITSHKRVVLRNLEVLGYKACIRAASASAGGLTIDHADIHDYYRQHLKSTPAAEDSGDWLWPHTNDNHDWVTNYGGAICIDRTEDVTIHDVTTRRGQNGIILDRVTHAKVYDNDCSFLSGWGLAMWRSNENLIERNAFDFCIRGHSEGVYNRGQDSAGILMFEQCSRNQFIENSVTHGGDGFFGFAGKEAIGEVPPTPRDPYFDYLHAGCNENVLAGNDFSYAAAHGVELTFSLKNQIVGNRIVENAICGVWGGYSMGTLIEGNTFERNGGMAYGLERGGVNIEHGSDNKILHNTFTNNRCGVHLWWDDDGKLMGMPGVKARDRGVSDNVISGNTFTIDQDNPFKGERDTGPLVVLQLRDTGEKHLKHNVFAGNTVKLSDPRAKSIEATSGSEPLVDDTPDTSAAPATPQATIGTKKPVGARDSLKGRAAIIMDEWGPWDHESPLVRRTPTADGDVFDVFGAKAVEHHAASGGIRIQDSKATPPVAASFTVTTTVPVNAYDISVVVDGQKRTMSGLLNDSTWEALVFPWTKDPRTDHDGWMEESRGNGIVVSLPHRLDLPLNNGGPRAVKEWKDKKDALPGADHYGIIASTYIKLLHGKYRVTTLSDDGIKVEVIWGKRSPAVRKTIIDNMTWHAPTKDVGEFVQEKDNEEVQLRVEYFQIDGAAALNLKIEPE